MCSHRGSFGDERSRVMKAFLTCDLYPYDDEPVFEHILNVVVEGRTRKAKELLRELDSCRVGDGTRYENAVFRTLKECLGGAVNGQRARQRTATPGGPCDIELPFRVNALHHYPFWEPWFYRYHIRSILAEVKNRKSLASSADAGQIKRYLDTSNKGRFGMIISRNGFTKDALATLRVYATSREEDQVLILPISGPDLRQLTERSIDGAFRTMEFLCEKEVELLQK